MALDGSTDDSIQKDLYILDNVIVRIGSGDDLRIKHNGTDSYIENHTGTLNIANYADDKDIKFYSDDGSGGITEYFKLDGANVQMVASQKLAFSDNVRATFGDSSDLQIYHDGSNSIIHDTELAI